jgi:squalene-hopene/tetraprenyl-beta-curcumene cyclase
MTPLDLPQSDSLRRADSIGASGAMRLQPTSALDVAVGRAERAVLAAQHADGYWCYELEADCTIPAEYVLMMHFFGEVDTALQERLARFLRAHQVAEHGWPLFSGGAFDLSCSVKAYYALKLAGDSADAPHMVAARTAILSHGGAARSNVFTRITLALFEQVPWRAVPFMPVEIVLLPRWFPFHLEKVSYWSRAVVVPMLILCSLKAKARNPHGGCVRELFTVPPEEVETYFPARSPLNAFFNGLSAAGRLLEPLVPKYIRNRALRAAEGWVVERLNGTGGLGAIFPAMVNACEALDVLGYARTDPRCVTARDALKRLLVDRGDTTYCQPCVSPVWDTALACLALHECGRSSAQIERALDWLKARQLLDAPGDWRASKPKLAGGGWPFQFENDHYPDLDDTAVVAWAMHQVDDLRHERSISRAVEWIRGMQSKGGGFGSFDVDNTHYYLNEIPFADHGALLDPPTADVSGRCTVALARVARTDGRYRDAVSECLAYLRREQEPSGAWFGRWGTNYIYGTWSVLVALEQAGVPHDDPGVRRAAAWLKDVQRPDGGWGEDNFTYFDSSLAGTARASTSFQTAWALLALMAAGEARAPEVARGVQYLMHAQKADGTWYDVEYTAPGFPRVFFLKYHGYSHYFPLWALARYRKLIVSGAG